MNKGLWFTIGLGIGSTITFFVTKYVLENKYQDMIDETVNNVWKQLEGEYSSNKVQIFDPKSIKDPIEKTEIGISNESKEMTKEDYIKKTSNKYNEMRTNYHLINKKENTEKENDNTMVKYKDERFDDLADDDREDDELEPIDEDDEIMEDPYLITEVEFDEGKDEYDKISLTYYDGDDILIDEDGDVITDPDEIIGEDALISFGTGSSDKNMVYVRNEKLQCDYEIIREFSSYYK